MLNSFSNFAKKAYNHVFEEPLVEFDGFSAILATGYQTVELKEKLNSFNGCDTDEDTLTDWDEVDVDYWASCGLITFDDNNNIILPTVEQCMKFTELSYVKEGLDRFQSELGVNLAQLSVAGELCLFYPILLGRIVMGIAIQITKTLLQ